jgi:hypothetical protein
MSLARHVSCLPDDSAAVNTLQGLLYLALQSTRLYLGVYMPKRVLVSSLKVKTLTKLFDSSPSKMSKERTT